MLSVPNPISSLAAARPEHIVLRAGAGAIAAQALLQAVVERAGLWREGGVRAGETVALWGPPDIDFVINVHALGWLGAAVAPLAWRAPPAEHVRHLALAQCRRIVVAADIDAAMLAGLQVALGQGVGVLRSPALNVPAAKARTQAQPHSHAAPPERFWPADEVRLVLLSSGSTGAPHLVRLSTSQLLFSAMGSATRLGHDVCDVWLLCLPLHHVGGLSILFRAAFFGASVTLLPRFEPAVVAASLADGSISLVSLVPQMLGRVLDAAAQRAAEATRWAASPRLRAILLGGAPPPQALLARCRALSLPVCVTWGMTEAASQIATTWPGRYGGAGDCGPPLPFARVLPQGTAGALVVAGPVVGEHPVTTSDWGQLDSAGRVQVHGRIDDILISGGENIAPFEVESVLLEHPLIADAAVIGVDDSTWGQRPVAVLVGHADPLNDAALVAWCRDRLAPFKIPAQFIWCRSLPRDALGKLRRKQVLLDVQQGVDDV